VQPGHDADPSPPSNAEVKEQSRVIPLLSLRAFVAYDMVKPTYLLLQSLNKNYFLCFPKHKAILPNHHHLKKMEQSQYTVTNQFYVFVGPNANGRNGGKVQSPDNIALTEIWPEPSKKRVKLRKTQNVET
jgi:hypothetical protein